MAMSLLAGVSTTSSARPDERQKAVLTFFHTQKNLLRRYNEAAKNARKKPNLFLRMKNPPLERMSDK